MSQLVEERSRATFPVEALTEFLFDGPQRLARVRELKRLVANDPIFCRRRRRHATRMEQYKLAVEQSAHIVELSRHLPDVADKAVVRKELDTDLPFGLHDGMFTPTIRGQGSPEQQEYWLNTMGAQSYRIIGTYAQTEMGHGSYVRGLETRADYDASTREFVLTSPTLTSTKWWPGGLGKTSTHAVVMAQLHTRGQCHGVHAFIVQLRSLDDHQPLRGITVGDIGPKLGYNPMDNGFLRLDRVRIPREHMLMRFSQVHPDGRYTRTPNTHPKVTYATMVYVRAHIVNDSGLKIAKATTIAVRYSAVRAQFSVRDGEPEQPILNYQTQLHTLMPLVATSYAFTFAGKHLMTLYRRFSAELDKPTPNFAMLPELHAASAGLKALTTWDAIGAIDACRQACGGHGYSAYSGLPTLYVDYAPATTYEGDNTVMCFQTARFLLKAVSSRQPLKGTLAYLTSHPSKPCAVRSVQDWLNPAVLLEAFQCISAYLVNGAAARLKQEMQQGGVSLEEAQEKVKVDMVRITKAHSRLLVLTFFHDTLTASASRALPPPVLTVLRHLCVLYGVSVLEGALGDLVLSHFATPTQAELIHAAVRSAVATVRPDAVALVDAFDLTDYYLNSALGRSDGRVYETLYDWAQQSPLNRSQVAPGYIESIAPLIKSSL